MDIPGYEKYEIVKKGKSSAATVVIIFVVLALGIFGMYGTKVLNDKNKVHHGQDNFSGGVAPFQSRNNYDKIIEHI